VSRERIVRALARLAIVLGAVAAVAGSPYVAERGNVDVQALASIVQREDDHVTAMDLARWIKERQRALRVIDVRSPEEFEAYHVPTAERVPIDSLPLAKFRRGETIVLYSEGGAHAAQAWVFLRAMGYDSVYFLRGGLYEWLDLVMNPAFVAAKTPTDSAKLAEMIDVSRYFGGTPHIGVRSAIDEVLPTPDEHGAERSQTAAAVARIRRRGC
jgi:sulfur-carrier protein adenylyltransferase/sulfurtransferase